MAYELQRDITYYQTLILYEFEPSLYQFHIIYNIIFLNFPKSFYHHMLLNLVVNVLTIPNNCTPI